MNTTWRARVQGLLEPVRRELSQPAIVVVLGIVLGFHAVVQLDAVRRAFPFIERAQMEFHRLLWKLSPRSPSAKWVRGVEIDDEVHARLGEPTNRAYLATLVTNAMRGGAAVIVIDVTLLTPTWLRPGEDDAARTKDNNELFEAVRAATANGVAVVLATWLQPHGHGEFTTRANIFDRVSLPQAGADGACSNAQSSADPALEPPPACVRFGNINLPVDKRRIPLVTPVRGGAASPSLALTAVDAYEEWIDRQPRTRHKPPIADAIEEGTFVFGSFIPESQFQKVSIEKLANGDEHALRLAQGRILVIGGTWRKDLGHGDEVDTHLSPVGHLRGMYLHANYIEALLDDRYSREVPLWLALGFDFCAGMWLYIRFHAATTRWARLRLLLAPAAILLTTYVVFANLNLYLDFILPLGGCFVHLAVEYVRDYRNLRSASHAATTKAGAGQLHGGM